MSGEDDIAKRHTQRLERLQEARADDPIHHNEMVAFSISLRRLCQDVDHRCVLRMGFRQIGDGPPF